MKNAADFVPENPLFPATIWSVVIEAREDNLPRASQALEQLASAY